MGEHLKFQAGIHGINVDGEKEEGGITKTEETTTTKVDRSTNHPYMFKDPSEYNHLSDDERKELTKKMMGFHKGWVNRTPL